MLFVGCVSRQMFYVLARMMVTTGDVTMHTDTLEVQIFVVVVVFFRRESCVA